MHSPFPSASSPQRGRGLPPTSRGGSWRVQETSRAQTTPPSRRAGGGWCVRLAGGGGGGAQTRAEPGPWRARAMASARRAAAVRVCAGASCPSSCYRCVDAWVCCVRRGLTEGRRADRVGMWLNPELKRQKKRLRKMQGKEEGDERCDKGKTRPERKK